MKSRLWIDGDGGVSFREAAFQHFCHREPELGIQFGYDYHYFGWLSEYPDEF